MFFISRKDPLISFSPPPFCAGLDPPRPTDWHHRFFLPHAAALLHIHLLFFRIGRKKKAERYRKKGGATEIWQPTLCVYTRLRAALLKRLGEDGEEEEEEEQMKADLFGLRQETR